jgi:hypothetical protein
MGRVALLAVIGSLIPDVTQAECITIPIPEGQRYKETKPELAFSGTVTSVDPQNYLVSFIVDRVWRGRVRRNQTLAVAPEIEGPGIGYFRVGETYLVRTHIRAIAFNDRETAKYDLPPNTLAVFFGCSFPAMLKDAEGEIKRLGRGQAPRP